MLIRAERNRAEPSRVDRKGLWRIPESAFGNCNYPHSTKLPQVLGVFRMCLNSVTDYGAVDGNWRSSRRCCTGTARFLPMPSHSIMTAECLGSLWSFKYDKHFSVQLLQNGTRKVENVVFSISGARFGSKSEPIMYPTDVLEFALGMEPQGPR